MLVNKCRDFYLQDRNANFDFEPSGEDFLSPTLMEADLMTRVMDSAEFAQWLHNFLPGLSDVDGESWLQPGRVADPTDGRLVHIDGLNLTRAWALAGIAQHLPVDDQRLEPLLRCAAAHRARGLDAVTGEHYAGSHWLASFAVYLLARDNPTS